jgi:hypothetical protein
MNTKSCKIFVNILFPILILSNCTGGGQPNSSTFFAANQTMVAVTDLDQNQRNIATRICYAYESKSNNFHYSDYLLSKFNFGIEVNKCNSTVKTYNVTTTLSDNTTNFYFLKVDGIKFYEVVQTDTSGYLSKLCNKIKQNSTISNTTSIGTQSIQIYFFADSLDSYIIKYFSPNTSGNLTSISAETFKVRTQFNYQNGQILGMDEVYISESPCPNSTTSTYKFTQNYLSRNK